MERFFVLSPLARNRRFLRKSLAFPPRRRPRSVGHPQTLADWRRESSGSRSTSARTAGSGEGATRNSTPAAPHPRCGRDARNGLRAGPRASGSRKRRRLFRGVRPQCVSSISSRLAPATTQHRAALDRRQRRASARSVAADTSPARIERVPLTQIFKPQRHVHGPCRPSPQASHSSARAGCCGAQSPLRRINAHGGRALLARLPQADAPSLASPAERSAPGAASRDAAAAPRTARDWTATGSR